MIGVVVVPVDDNLIADVGIVLGCGALLQLVVLVEVIAQPPRSGDDLLYRIFAVLQRSVLDLQYMLVQIEHSPRLKGIPGSDIIRDIDYVILKLLHEHQRVLIDLVVHAREALFEVFIGIDHHDAYGKCCQSRAVYDKQQDLPDEIDFLFATVHIYCFSTLYPTPHTTLR